MTGLPEKNRDCTEGTVLQWRRWYITICRSGSKALKRYVFGFLLQWHWGWCVLPHLGGGASTSGVKAFGTSHLGRLEVVSIFHPSVRGFGLPRGFAVPHQRVIDELLDVLGLLYEMRWSWKHEEPEQTGLFTCCTNHGLWCNDVYKNGSLKKKKNMFQFYFCYSVLGLNYSVTLFF